MGLTITQSTASNLALLTVCYVHWPTQPPIHSRTVSCLTSAMDESFAVDWGCAMSASCTVPLKLRLHGALVLIVQ